MIFSIDGCVIFFVSCLIFFENTHFLNMYVPIQKILFLKTVFFEASFQTLLLNQTQHTVMLKQQPPNGYQPHYSGFPSRQQACANVSTFFSKKK